MSDYPSYNSFEERILSFVDGLQRLPLWAQFTVIVPMTIAALLYILPFAAAGWAYDWLLSKWQERCITSAGYFLRDDRPIREGNPEFLGREQGYSLFNNFGECEAVYTGDRRWAVQDTYDRLFRKGQV